MLSRRASRAAKAATARLNLKAVDGSLPFGRQRPWLSTQAAPRARPARKAQAGAQVPCLCHRQVCFPETPSLPHSLLTFSNSEWPVVYRRRSLTNAFQSVKARCSRDKLYESGDGTDPGNSFRRRRCSRISKEIISSPIAAKPMIEPPPRLDVLSELPWDGLHRSSTFRASLEKAVEDINNKYGASCTSRLPENQGSETTNGDHTADSHPALDSARSNFKPRYRLPTFVYVPMVRALPSAGQVTDVSPSPSNESTRSDRTQMGSLVAKRHIDDILHQTLDTPTFSGALAADDIADRCQVHNNQRLKILTSPLMPLKPPSVAIEKNELESKSSYRSEVGTGELNLSGQDTKVISAQLPSVRDADAASGTLQHGLDNGTPSSNSRADDFHTNNIDIETEEKPFLPKSLDSSILALKRIRRTPGSSQAGIKPEKNETPEAMNAPLQRARAQVGKPSTATQEQRAPSVSELVNKFRLMATPQNELRQAHAALVGDAKTTGTCRSRFSSNDSEDDSTAYSNSDYAETSPQHALARKRRFVTSTNASGDDDLRLIRDLE